MLRYENSLGNKLSLDTVMLTLARPGHRESRNGIEFGTSTAGCGKIFEPYVTQTVVEIGRRGPVHTDSRFPEESLHSPRREELPLFDLGFDGDVLRSKKLVASVREDSEAFKAGVREEQEVLGMSIYWNDVNKPVRLTIRAASGRLRIEYFPKERP